jgi:hypothetical protein
MDILAKELHKVAKKKYDVRPVNVIFQNEVWAADLVDMIEWNKENKEYKYILTIIDVFTKYAWAMPLKNKTSQTITDTFSNIFKKTIPSKLWVDRGSEFYNKTFEKLLKSNDIVMYSTYSNNKSVVIERFNRTLKTYMFRLFTQNNNRNWINILDNLIKYYNDKTHSTIGMSPNDASLKKNYETVLQNTLDSQPKLIKKKPKFKINDVVRISRVKGIFEKGFHPNWSQETFEIVEVLNTNPITYKLKDMKNEILEGSFYSEELQKTKLKDTLLVESILKEKSVKGKKQYYVKFLGLSNKFNKWLSAEDLKELDEIKAD